MKKCPECDGLLEHKNHQSWFSLCTKCGLAVVDFGLLNRPETRLWAD